ncbi:hypothetical protein AGMMS50293_25400 [Spirochaetia bacterium]|nr:hypothetical protein AGMMS50293_25400 [Spirochaetia bacterium]
MLKKIELLNYKSFLQSSLDLKSLTVLTGLNSSGKSSIIQAINMVFRYYLSQNQHIALSDHGSPHLLKSKYSKDNFFKIVIHADPDGKFELLVSVDADSYSFDKAVVQKTLPELQYISASRLGPQNVLSLSTESSAPEIGSKGEYIIDFIERNQNRTVYENMIKDAKETTRLWENINAWMQYISPGTVLSYKIQRDQNAAYPYYNGILPTESGFGLSYTLPIITALLMPNSARGSVLLLENPEAHLHPKGQTAIGELISLSAASGKQIIVETHSDHVIDGIRIAARQNKITYTNVAFHYFEKNNSESESTIESPELLPDGKLSFWPKGFFDQNMLNKAELLKK